jgi:ABC-type dipeptide/oligopeptide/nickel transport system permease subunit
MHNKVEDYVEAARAVGNPHRRIALRHIMPNVLPPLIVQATLSIASAVIAEVSLSLLGLSQQPPLTIWVVCSTSPKTTWITRRGWQCRPVLRFFCWCYLLTSWGMACAMRWTFDKNE